MEGERKREDLSVPRPRCKWQRGNTVAGRAGGEQPGSGLVCFIAPGIHK